MNEEIKVLEKELEKIQAPVLKYFRPPLVDENTLIAFIHKHWGNDVKIPMELIEFFKWHNGTDYTSAENGQITAGYISDELCFVDLLKIEDLIKGEPFFEYVPNKLFPLFVSFNGEELALKLEGENELIFCSTSDYEIDSLISMYDNLTSFVNTTISFYKNKCLTIGEDGTIEMARGKYSEFMLIGERMNPKSDYWRVKREFQED